MDIKIESTENDREPNKLSPPPDFMSRGAKIKLFTLVGSLLLVLVLMNEARKPDNWKWMGFDSQGKQRSPSEEPKKFVVEESQYPPREQAEPDPQSTQKETSQQQDPILDTPSTTAPEQEGPEVEGPTVSLAQPEFYQLFFKQLELNEQRGLFAALRELRGRGFSNEREFDCLPLVRKMDSAVRVHLSEILNDLSLIDEGKPKRVELNEQLETMQRQWEQTLKPALAGEPITNPTKLRTVHALQSELDEAAFSIVNDKSSPTWASDDPAWLRVWERILNVGRGWQVEQMTTPIQLKAEPDFYRGKPVAMEGELRGVEVLQTNNNPMGIKQYYSLWIRPQASAIQPFNVYVTQLPDPIELSADRFTSLEGIQVELLGAFFKIRTYKDAAGEISETPLVFAKSFQVIEGAAEELAVPVAEPWQPSAQLLTAFFVGMPLLAIGIAFVVYRGTTSRKFRLGVTATAKVNESLDELGGDPNVQTVAEKLAKLESKEVAQ